LIIIYYYHKNVFLLRLDSTVNVRHEKERGVKTQGTQSEGKHVCDDPHVSKVEGGLKHSLHLRFLEEKVEAIGKHEYTCRSRSKKGSPPPSVILTDQQKVSKGHRDKGCDEYDHGKSNGKNTEKSVQFMSPNAFHNVMKLDVDGTEHDRTGN
jgi:hypothetical protein